MDIKSINEKLKEFEDTGYIDTRDLAKMSNSLLKIVNQQKDNLIVEINKLKNKL